jgi:hypothetical protein
MKNLLFAVSLLALALPAQAGFFVEKDVQLPEGVKIPEVSSPGIHSEVIKIVLPSGQVVYVLSFPKKKERYCSTVDMRGEMVEICDTK